MSLIKKQAQNQFNYKNYTWTIFSGMDYINHLGEDEFIKFLEKQHIKTKTIPIVCVRFPNDQYENCEEIEMNKLIEEKFGKKFIDSLRYIAKQTFIKSHPEEVFSYEYFDEYSRYPNSTINNQFDKMQDDYLSKYPTPKEYIRKNEKYYYFTSANFILTKDGKLKIYQKKANFKTKKTIYLKNNSINN